MIGISMVTSDLEGAVILDDGDSVLGNMAARVTRTATLDGGAVLTHSGVSHADRIFDVQTIINEAQKVSIEHIFEASERVFVSCSEGFFTGAIESIDTSTPALAMKILILERVSE